MKSQTLVAFIAAIAICSAVSSCKKDGGDKNANCRIVTATQVHGANTTIINLTYNNDGRISTLSTSGGSPINKVYTYSGNTLIINTTSSGSFISRDSITLNANGRPLNLRQYSNQAGTVWTNYSFEYNGNDLLKYQETTHVPGAPTTATMTSTNGNLTKLQTSTVTANLDYYPDKNVQPGDYLELLHLLNYGISLYPHKNLIKSLEIVGSNIANYNYEFDAEGLISKLTSTSGSTVTTITYQYQCN